MKPHPLLIAPVALIAALGGMGMAWAGVFSVNLSSLPEELRIPVAEQVRIEQHMSIRISPGPSLPPPQLLLQLQQDAAPPSIEERSIGKCLPVTGIAGVKIGSNNRLLLMLNDNRIVSAGLEKSCQARDFYAGFYVARSSDGQICVDRDQLQSRSGAKCKLSKLKQLIDPRTGK